MEIMFRRGGRLLLGGFALACLMLLTSCALLPSKLPQITASELIGTWDGPGGNSDRVVFAADGTVHFDRVPAGAGSNTTDVPNQTAKWVIIPEDIPGGIYISIDFLSSGIGGTSLAEKGDVGSRTLYFIIGDPDADVNVEYRKVG